VIKLSLQYFILALGLHITWVQFLSSKTVITGEVIPVTIILEFDFV
jgi:hypothetical protein